MLGSSRWVRHVVNDTTATRRGALRTCERASRVWKTQSHALRIKKILKRNKRSFDSAAKYLHFYDFQQPKKIALKQHGADGQQFPSRVPPFCPPPFSFYFPSFPYFQFQFAHMSPFSSSRRLYWQLIALKIKFSFFSMSNFWLIFSQIFIPILCDKLCSFWSMHDEIVKTGLLAWNLFSRLL